MRDGGWVKVAVGMVDLRVDGQYVEALVENGGLGLLELGSRIDVSRVRQGCSKGVKSRGMEWRRHGWWGRGKYR